ncbi:MAG: DUF2321 domain-containing protein [Propionibacteriaceae bacterium]|nr:DUF2321 domain-containing protein [Propionibacteriaceae bacterium]
MAEKKKSPKELKAEAKAAGVAYCPKCGSQSLSANKRGFSVVTGFIGAGKITITCLACGKKFKP